MLQRELELLHGRSAHPLYAQSLLAEQEYACASLIKHVVTRHARSAAANPMLVQLGIREAVWRSCSSTDAVAAAVAKEWLAVSRLCCDCHQTALMEGEIIRVRFPAVRN